MHERVGRRDEASRDQYRPRPYLVNVERGSDLIERPEPGPNPIEVCGQRAKLLVIQRGTHQIVDGVDRCIQAIQQAQPIQSDHAPDPSAVFGAALTGHPPLLLHAVDEA